MEVSLLSRSLVFRYALALVSVLLATWVRLLVDAILGNQFPLAIFYFAVGSSGSGRYFGELFFDPAADRDLGLGPPMAYRILSLFGASVSVRNRQPSGIQLTISLKDAAPDCGRTLPGGSGTVEPIPSR
jgi:hypothetical protein